MMEEEEEHEIDEQMEIEHEIEKQSKYKNVQSLLKSSDKLKHG